MSRSTTKLTRLASATPSSKSSPASNGASSTIPRILCFGDSLTEGYVARGTIMHPYATTLAQKLGDRAQVEESGVSGEVTQDMVPRLKAILDAAVAAKQPYALVIILGGTNDVCHEVDTKQIITQIRRLHELCYAHSPKCRTLAMTIPEIDTPKQGSMEAARGPRQVDRDMAKVNEAIRSWVNEPVFQGRFSLYDLCLKLPQNVPGPTNSLSQLWDNDKVHFSVAGYNWIGEQLFKCIDSQQLLNPPANSNSGTLTNSTGPTIPVSTAPDNKPDAARVYTGLNVGSGEGRKKFWSSLLTSKDARASTRSIDTSQLTDSIVNEIEMELELGHFSRFVPALEQADLDVLRRLLQKEAALHERETLGLGYAHLAARIYLACERDEARALDILCLVANKLRAYEVDAPIWNALRNDVLRVTDLLVSDGRTVQLCQHFNSVGFDLVDLSDVIVTWFSGLFCEASFPTEFCLRCIDLVLLDPKIGGGPENFLVGVLFGVMVVLSKKLHEECENSELLFLSLQDLPAAFTKSQISEIFTEAYFIYTNNVSQPPEIDWCKLVSQTSGVLRFQHTAMMKAMNQSGVSMNATAVTPTNGSAGGSSSSATAGGGAPTTLHLGQGVVAAGLSTTPSRTPAGGQDHTGQTMTFNLNDYTPEKSSTSKASTTATTTNTAAQPSPGASKTQTPTTTISNAKDLLQRHGSVVGNSVNTSLATTTITPLNDPTLLSELSAATSGNKSAAQLQTLLERAIKELKSQQQRIATTVVPTTSTASNLTVPPSTINTATPTSSATPTTTESTTTLFDVPIQQISPLEVHPLDRSSSINQSKKVVPPSGLIKHSELLEYQLFPALVMQGYLMKSRAPSKLFKRRGSSGFFGNLHRRYFVLTGHFLTYFKTHDDTKPTRDESVDLRTCVVMKIKNHEFAPFAMSIAHANTGANIYLLFAMNETHRDLWLQCFIRAAGAIEANTNATTPTIAPTNPVAATTTTIVATK